MHSNATSYRGSVCTKLIGAAAITYGIPQPLITIGQNMISELLKDGNLVRKKVYFNDTGFIWRSAADSNIQCFADPLDFEAHVRSQAHSRDIGSFGFNPSAHPALGARFEDTLDLTPLFTVALACTLAHYALKNLIRNEKQQE
ncbi:hypothetical protein M422DRAFT_248294 [Sphaerobolus stellatus SS14]|uniref:DUF6532 domain-containing protein n=1 Tax=Sphaerobolus stellatus (strain SS14) TaxID=990650 RepID=A0A0C9UWU6_SPHS4|nr:hypothetical protein M422DRAFT_248294 [Sphaerobolus stellatus SS14]